MENENSYIETFEIQPKKKKKKFFRYIVLGLLVFFAGYCAGYISVSEKYYAIPAKDAIQMSIINEYIKKNYYTDYDKDALFKS